MERKVASEVEAAAHFGCGVADCEDGYRGEICCSAFVTTRNPAAEEARRVVLIQQFARNTYNFIKKPWSSSSTLIMRWARSHLGRQKRGSTLKCHFPAVGFYKQWHRATPQL